MKRDAYFRLTAVLLAVLATPFCVASPLAAAGESDYAAQQQAFHEAAEGVADSVVQISLVGGLDRVGKTSLSQGPSTGLVVTEDGYIVSSAFNFAQIPSSILVTLPTGEKLPAQLVARDNNRMLVLLKVETDSPLPVPTPVPSDEMAVGQWSLALGRTYQADHVDVSLGLISALRRMYGRAIQTDANVSAANYGGPLVDIRGRVFGVLVPMAPGGGDESNELAGADFYDSGIGFAIPLEQILDTLPRMQAGTDLEVGRMGVGLKSGSAYTTPPVIESIWPGSPAEEAGWKVGDRIVVVDGQVVESQAELRFHVLPKYAGDKLSVSLRRGDKEEFDTEITLAGTLETYRHSFLGLLPKPTPDDEPKGVVVEAVWPGGPAAVAGVLPGDLILKLGNTKVANVDEARTVLRSLSPEKDITVELLREEVSQEVPLRLAEQPAEILAEADLPPAPVQAPGDKKPEIEKLKLPLSEREVSYLKPVDRPTTGMLFWLASGESRQREELLADWQSVCQSFGWILLVVEPEEENNWQSGELEFLQALVRFAPRQLGVDRVPLVIGGEAKAGQLALAFGLKNRGKIRGVIADDAPLPRTLSLPENSPTGLLDVLSISRAGSPLASLIAHDVAELRKSGRPVAEFAGQSKGNVPTLADPFSRAAIVRWLRGLDRL